MAKKLVLLLVAAALGLAVPGVATCDVTISLRLDRSEATLADTLDLFVSVSGAHGGDVQPTIRGLEDFQVRPAGTSTRVEIVNGRYSAGMEFTFLLQPKKAGNFRVGPAEVTVDGRTYQSDVVPLAVSSPAKSADGDRGPVFLVAELSPATVYVEQQALYTLKLFRSVPIGNASLAPPEAQGITFTKLGDPREYQGVYRGRSYEVIEVRYLVASHKEGRHALAPARMEMTVFAPQSRPRRGIFDDPFFGRATSGRPLTVVSEAREIQVLPLPREGRPADYGGLVGAFTLESTLEPHRVKAGESATLTATVRGRGNVRRIPELKVPPLDGVKIYADQPVQKEETDADGLSGSKVMKWALVPEKEGEYRVPALALSYFDATAGRYTTLKTSEATLVVTPGEGGAAPAKTRPAGATAAAPSPKEVAELGSDILPVHAEAHRPPSGLSALPQGLPFWILLLGPPGAFFLALGGVHARRRSGSLVGLRRERTAAAELLRTCRRADASADELLLALQGYVNRRLRLDRGSLTADEAAALLRSRGVDTETVEALTRVWRRMEDAVYTGRGRNALGTGEELAPLVARVEKVLR